MWCVYLKRRLPFIKQTEILYKHILCIEHKQLLKKGYENITNITNINKGIIQNGCYIYKFSQQ